MTNYEIFENFIKDVKSFLLREYLCEDVDLYLKDLPNDITITFYALNGLVSRRATLSYQIYSYLLTLYKEESFNLERNQYTWQVELVNWLEGQ